MAANTGGGVTAGVVAFAVFAVGFFGVCAAIIWWRAHSDATRVAAYFEDDSMPVRSSCTPCSRNSAAPVYMLLKTCRARMSARGYASET